MSQAFGHCSTLFHRSHGTFVLGSSIAEALDNLYYLERAAEVVVKARSMQMELDVISNKVAEGFKRKFQAENKEAAELHFKALKRVHCSELQWTQASQGLASKLGGIGLGFPASAAQASWGVPEGLGMGVNHKAMSSVVELSSSLSLYLTSLISRWSIRLRQAAGPAE
ncbi:hypothetical protein WJX74_010736 [Apatococcus lobatus]